MAFVKEMTVTVRSVITPVDAHGVPQGEDEVTELTSPAFLKHGDGMLSLSYTEQGEGGKTVCTVDISDGEVTVVRRGASVCELHFGDADDHGLYEVPPYSFPMTLHTLKLRNRMSADGGTLDIFYRMTLGADDRKVHLRVSVR